jgi:hypothetical protein
MIAARPVRGKDHDPNQSDGRLNEPGGTGPRRDGPPEAAQHCPRLGRPRTIGKRSPGSDGSSASRSSPAQNPSTGPRPSG